ncbi:MAG: carboxy terminal-processing peptidase [Syntrophotaleaceae bacterium]
MNPTCCSDPLPYLKSGERYADYALPWDTISPARYAPWQAQPFNLEALRKASDQRLADSARFQV